MEPLNKSRPVDCVPILLAYFLNSLEIRQYSGGRFVQPE